ncbi:MAG: excisionase family DNA-binding protein [Actinomycetota bacterium]|nr:excisionase family DNA-binding protein [Actinomycetota bacterium]
MDELSTLLDIGAVAERLCVTERHVRRLVAECRIPYVKVGRFVRFDPADVADSIGAARVLPRSLTHPPRMIEAEIGSARSRAAGSGSRR